LTFFFYFSLVLLYLVSIQTHWERILYRRVALHELARVMPDRYVLFFFSFLCAMSKERGLDDRIETEDDNDPDARSVDKVMNK
jgi:hypothetical protein